MASSFLIDDILRKECEKSPIGNMLNDFFYFLRLFEGSNKRLDGNQIRRHLSSVTSQLSEVKKRNAGLKTSPALDLPFISHEHFPKEKIYCVCKSIREFRL